MRLYPQRRWLSLLLVALVCVVAACGSTPTPGAGEATSAPPPEPAQPTASPTATATPTTAERASPTAALTATPTSPDTEPGTPSPTPSATPTPMAGGPITATPKPSACEGLRGELEVQILVGPADAVGLEPHAVGTIPFSVTSSEPPYLIQGGGPISYDRTLEEEWGTYQVTLDLAFTIEGECVADEGDGHLHMVVEMTGEQMVEVTAEGFHGEYPWAGSHTRTLDFPIVEGATAEGEGWRFVLHLLGP